MNTWLTVIRHAYRIHKAYCEGEIRESRAEMREDWKLVAQLQREKFLRRRAWPSRADVLWLVVYLVLAPLCAIAFIEGVW